MFSVQMNHVKLYSQASIIVFRMPTSMAKQTRCCASNDSKGQLCMQWWLNLCCTLNYEHYVLECFKKWEV